MHLAHVSGQFIQCTPVVSYVMVSCREIRKGSRITEKVEYVYEGKSPYSMCS